MSEVAATVLVGDCRDVLKTLPDASVHCCVTSPPYYGLRDYHVSGQIGLEETLQEYVANLVAVFREVWRVLRPDGTLWLNLGDSYANDTKWGGRTGGKHAAGLHGQPIGRARRATGLKSKDMMGIPWRAAFALQDDGWYLRSDIIWAKPNPMPESVIDRPTKAHEYIFLLSKSERYYYDADSIREPSQPERTAGRNSSCVNDKIPVSRKKHMKVEPLQGNHGVMGHDGNGMRYDRVYNNPLGRNKRSVWSVAAEPVPFAHFATFPQKLIEPCILAGCPEGGTVLDPFSGSGTTLRVALKHRRSSIGIDLNPDYAGELTTKRLTGVQIAMGLEEAM